MALVLDWNLTFAPIAVLKSSPEQSFYVARGLRPEQLHLLAPGNTAFRFLRT